MRGRDRRPRAGVRAALAEAALMLSVLVAIVCALTTVHRSGCALASVAGVRGDRCGLMRLSLSLDGAAGVAVRVARLR